MTVRTVLRRAYSFPGHSFSDCNFFFLLKQLVTSLGNLRSSWCQKESLKVMGGEGPRKWRMIHPSRLWKLWRHAAGSSMRGRVLVDGSTFNVFKFECWQEALLHKPGCAKTWHVLLHALRKQICDEHGCLQKYFETHFSSKDQVLNLAYGYYSISEIWHTC